MFRLILTIIFILASSKLTAEAATLPIEKGSEDLLQNSTLTQPVTVLDQLLLGLKQRADQISSHIQPQKNDFRWANQEIPTLSSVQYDKTLRRTVVEFDLAVGGMDDPWRNVCTKHIKEIVGFGYLSLPNTKTRDPLALGFISSILGPGIVSNFTQLHRLRSFFDSIVVDLSFKVVDRDQSGDLEYLRDCYYDNKTGHVTYYEYKY